MQKRMLILVAALFAAVTASAQMPKFDPPPELKKLDWMIGEWKGEGTSHMPGGAQRVLVHEVVKPELAGAILYVRGQGHARKEDGSAGELVHDAFGVIGYDRFVKKFTFDPWIKGGIHTDTTFEVADDGSVEWGFTTPQGGKVRYRIKRTEKGEWNEAGEFSFDGTKWMKTFEMTLAKVK